VRPTERDPAEDGDELRMKFGQQRGAMLSMTWEADGDVLRSLKSSDPTVPDALRRDRAADVGGDF
jgi:hypothetical protein